MKSGTKKLITFLSCLILLFTTNINHAFADREAPAPVEPIIYDNLKIMTVNSPDTMGIVQAYDVNTDELLWRTQVYRVKIKKWIEADTQWVFIKSMKIENDILVVINEKDKVYELNPSTGENINSNNIGTAAVIIGIILLILGGILLFILKKRKR